MLLVFSSVTVLFFPLGAVWAWHRGGARGLLLMTAAAVVLVIVLALFAASGLGGNRLVETRGYGYTATRTLLLAGLVVIAPVVASAISVWATAPRLASRVVYLIAVSTAIIGFAVGSTVAIYTLWS